MQVANDFTFTTKALMLISLLLTLVIVGICLYVLNTLVPLDAKIKTVINIVVVIVVVVYILECFGIIPAHTIPALK